MKKLLLILVAFFPLLTYAQVIDTDNVKWELKNKDGFNVKYTNWGEIVISDSVVTCTIRPKSYTPFWAFEIKNDGVEKIIVKWKEAAMGSYNTSRILFGDMRKFEINREIPDATIYKGSSLRKDIVGENYIGEYSSGMVLLKQMKDSFKKTKKTQYTNVTIIIPIEYNGIEKLYKFELDGEYAGKIKK